MFILVDDIQYPDLDEAMKPPREKNEIISPPQPLVNRTNKPPPEMKQIEEQYVEPPIQPVPLPRSNIPRTPSVDKGTIDSPLVNRTISVPQIDRNLKMSAMLKYLQDEEKMVEKHLAMTVERLKQEEEWDMIRKEKEASAHSEIANQLQEREEKMIEILKKMESDNKKQVLTCRVVISYF